MESRPGVLNVYKFRLCMKKGREGHWIFLYVIYLDSGKGPGYPSM
jgi:hypothetical protein